MTNIKHVDKLTKNIQSFKSLANGSVFTKVSELNGNKVSVLYMKLNKDVCIVKKFSSVPTEEDYTMRRVLSSEEEEYNAICLTIRPGTFCLLEDDCLVLSPSHCTLETDYKL